MKKNELNKLSKKALVKMAVELNLPMDADFTKEDFVAMIDRKLNPKKSTAMPWNEEAATLTAKMSIEN